MKRVLYLLLFIAACRSSSSDREVGNTASLTEKVLDMYITTAFRPEMFHGDIEHISETTYEEHAAADAYIKKDTILKEYSFKDHRLHQIATVTRRMLNDTLTIQYDTAGRILTLINSDGLSTYNTDRFKYDEKGRRIEKVNRLYTTESHQIYKYKGEDTLLIMDGTENPMESIVMKEKGDVTTVKYHLTKDDEGSSTVDEYNRKNQLVTELIFFAGVAETKVAFKYDDRGNLVAWDYQRGDSARGIISDKSYKARSFTVEYTYDDKGNWISRKEQARDTSYTVMTTRKIAYK